MSQVDQKVESINSEIESIVQDPNMTVSTKIRTLHSMGQKRSQIAKLLNKRYQHVRNVLITPLKKT